MSRATPTLSIVVPALDEAAGIARLLQRLPPLPAGTEVLVVDGGSRDDTVAAARAHEGMLARRGVRLTVLQARRGRAGQMNAGAARARGEILLFLHADTQLPPAAAEVIAAALRRPDTVGGGFRHRFQEGGLGLRLVSMASNTRARVRGILYGDQAIFVRAETFRSLGGYRAMPIFEDADLSARLRRRGRVVLLPVAVRTSGRRFLRGGILRTILRMGRMKLAYSVGRDPSKLVGDYWDRPRRGLGMRQGR